MKKCIHCGTDLADDAGFCTACGTAQPAQQAQQGPNYSNGSQQGNYYQGNGYQQQAPYQGMYTGPNKGMAVVAYITWIGLLISVLSTSGQPKDEFLKVHQNNALVIMLFSLVGNVLVWIPGINFLGGLWSIFILVLIIMGIVSASNGETKESPVLGQIHILK